MAHCNKCDPAFRDLECTCDWYEAVEVAENSLPAVDDEEFSWDDPE